MEHNINTQNQAQRTQDSPSKTIKRAQATQPHQNKHHPKKQRKLPATTRSTGSHEEVLTHDINSLRNSLNLPPTSKPPHSPLPDIGSTIDLKIHSLSSTGVGLGPLDSHIYAIPFAYVGDTVQARITKHHSTHSTAYPIHIVSPSPDRDAQNITCRYFGVCSGCQLQPLPYPVQLEHKKRIVERAYANFSGLPATSVPSVRETVGSPLQYGYRTKLTPHFDGPRNMRGVKRRGETPKWERVPCVGFNVVEGSVLRRDEAAGKVEDEVSGKVDEGGQDGTMIGGKGSGLRVERGVLDVEECPIGTASLNLGMTRERKRVGRDLERFRKGATILLRESSKKIANPQETSAERDGTTKRDIDDDETTALESMNDYTLKKSCTSDHKGYTTEYVGDYIFKNPANAFFQNNNSILPEFIQYIRDNIMGPSATAESGEKDITNLIDAYSGSGLFSITLHDLFTHTLGIDISAESIRSAAENLSLNGLNLSSDASKHSSIVESHQNESKSSTDQILKDSSQQKTINFLAGDASSLFASADPSIFSGSNTAVIIDPPRKGCDEQFLTQLLAFAPKRIVYVSCNVHTQARDVGWILRGGKEGKDGEKNDVPNENGESSTVEEGDYVLENLRGFDFFPQTAHVEGVAVLRRRG